MKRQDIHIENLEFICDLYKADVDYSPVVYKEFVIIRNIDFINGIACDTDIYFLEKSCYEKIKNSKSEKTDVVAFPCYNSKFGSFSSNYSDFVTILDTSSFKLESDGGTVFSLYKNIDGKFTNENIKIKCDKIRIYHPYNKTNLDYIIYLDNVINGIHFHYLCNYSNNYETYSETEFKVHNNVYSEYIEVYIPNVSELFTKHEIINGVDNNIYFNDFYNITKYIDEYNVTNKKQSSWISANENKSNTLFDDAELLSMVPLYLLLNPYIFHTTKNDVEEKIYFRMSNTECNNYNAFPINITLYPYTISDSTDILLLNDKYTQNSDTYVNDYYFNLVSNVQFSNGEPCVVSKFMFNNKYDKIANPDGLTTQEAYAKYNGLHIEKNENGEWYCPLYEGWYDYRNLSYDKLKEMLKTTKSEDEKQKLTELITMQEDSIETENFGENCFIKCCGYQIDIATDLKFSNIIASDYREMRFIDDFDFSLLNLFDNWYNVSKILIIRIKFIDKYLGIVLNTGNIILTKEMLKYCINNSYVSRILYNLNEKQNDLSDNMAWGKQIKANESTFNFIDKINCIVNKSDDTKIINANTQGVKIIYKPIFYKTQELQSIYIKSGFKQKIGINLSQYMTKVSIFKLIIDSLEISEYGRNDIYVIFEINGSDLTNASGTYNILDYDDNFISSGTYSVS